MNTLALDNEDWDLTVDLMGNIAVASGDPPDPIGLAQDAASAIRLFIGELWYDTTQGIPYFSQILGERPPISLLRAYFTAAAKTVPGVIAATCFISSITNRGISGQVQITSATGQKATANFASLVPPQTGQGPALIFSDPTNSMYLPGTP